jgi:hemoglobin
MALFRAVSVVALALLIAAGGSSAEAQTKKSLYDRIGGEKALTMVVDDFVARAAANPKVNFLRSGAFAASSAFVTQLKGHLVAFMGQAFGGPQKYTGRTMRDAHKGMRITQAEFDALAADLKATLEKHKLGKAEMDEIMKIAASTSSDIVEVK